MWCNVQASRHLTFTKAALEVKCHSLPRFYTSATRLPFTWSFPCLIFIEIVWQISELLCWCTPNQALALNSEACNKDPANLPFITQKPLQKTLGFLCPNSHIRDAIRQLEPNLRVWGYSWTQVGLGGKRPPAFSLSRGTYLSAELCRGRVE